MLWLVTDQLQDSRHMVHSPSNFSHNSATSQQSFTLMHIMFILCEVSFPVDPLVCHVGDDCTDYGYYLTQSRYQCCVEWGGGSTSVFGQSACTPC